ncbi:hypothetical protein C1752_03809 [Acaryochloris thomasi RCC1774]|uniref:PIN domain-containing protein n=1 Tax=Acaryochloris thomasi RCC1774 TaxID=1764569 RepID=A0A2W1JEM9_9CYAN|nr:type II toxin-antitoxin system VapC family toxin [Acaryochloris thomasi]PZD72223.1 hypothetical protein C1752_03809 [Acaryochloris thomasi RCC1774]
MNIVADTNIFLAVTLEEESKDRIIEVTEGCSLYAPEILPYEIGNALSAMVKRHQIEGMMLQRFITSLRKFQSVLPKLIFLKL